MPRPRKRKATTVSVPSRGEPKTRANAQLSFSKLADLGVRRISVGSALACVAWGAFIRAAHRIATTGSFDVLADGVPFAEINAAFGSQA